MSERDGRGTAPPPPDDDDPKGRRGDGSTSPLDWALVERLFLEARRLPPGPPRSAFLTEHADVDPRVLHEVRGLLRNDRADAFLEAPGNITLLGYLGQAAPLPEHFHDHVLVDRYELGRKIGSGASGGVFEGRDRVTGFDVAVKIIQAPRYVQQARAELGSLRVLRMRGVVELLDDTLDRKLGMCLVMERVRGRPFGAGDLPRPWATVRPWLISLLETLSRMHARGLVHKDLKPGNVLVKQDGQPVVLDFGVAGILDEIVGEKPRMVGTPAYMAPDVLAGARPDERSDLHAVGLMALEALRGAPVYPAKLSEIVVEKDLLDDAQIDAWLTPLDLPDDATTLLRGLLQYAASKRPASARAARALLGGTRRLEDQPALRATEEAGLRSLFRGHEAVYLIPSDAAHELWRRTRGDPEAVLLELEAWEAARLGSWTSDGFEIDRAALQELRDGLHPRVPIDPPPTPTAPASVAQVLPYIRALPTSVPSSILAGVPSLAEVDVEGAVEALVDADFLYRTADGRIQPTAGCLALALDDAHAARCGALADAMPKGLPGRLDLLAQADRHDELAEESLAAVEVAFRDSNQSQCIRLALLGLRMNPDPGLAFHLRAYLLRGYLPGSNVAGLQMALAQCERSTASEPRDLQLEKLGRSALLSLREEIRRAWDLLPDRGDLVDERLVPLHGMIQNYLFRHLPSAERRERIEAAFGPVQEASEVMALSAWAWHHFLDENPGDALPLFLELIEEAPTRISRVGQKGNALYALMHLFRLDEAEALAREALAEATEARSPAHIGALRLDLRNIAYMRGGLPPLDPALLAAQRTLARRRNFERVLVSEAAIAWRRGNEQLARTYIQDAYDQPDRGPGHPRDPVTTGFHYYLQHGFVDVEVEETLRALEDVEISSDVWQLLAFIARRQPGALQPAHHEAFREAIAKTPRAHWAIRQEVLSIDEAVKWIGGLSQA